jgi:hypothetical protein
MPNRREELIHELKTTLVRHQILIALIYNRNIAVA